MVSLRPPGAYPLQAREEADRIWLWCPRYVIFLDLARRECEARLTKPLDWQSVLRVIYFFCSLENDFLLLHASGVVHRERAYIFPGRSGAGKTTVVRNSIGMTVLTDEMSSVHLGANGSGIRAHGTPFFGDWDQPGLAVSAPVKGLYFPCHSAENRLTLLSPTEVLTRLLPCTCTYSNKKERLDKILDLAVKLSERIRGFQLDFLPTPDFWRMIDGS